MKIENVYFIYNTEGELIYIGKSNGMRVRFKGHGCGYKLFDEDKVRSYYLFKDKEEVSRITYIEASAKEVFEIEANYISYYKPRYNIKKREKPFDISKYTYPIQEYDIEKNHNLRLSKLKDITHIGFDKVYSTEELEKLLLYYKELESTDPKKYYKFTGRYNYNLIDSLCLLLEDIEYWIEKVKNVIASLIHLEKKNLIELKMYTYGKLSIQFKQI